MTDEPCPDCGHAVTVADPCRCDYETWLARQHRWMFERMGLNASDPLAVAVAALDRIARKAINDSGVDKYWLARSALEKVGAWPRSED